MHIHWFNYFHGPRFFYAWHLNSHDSDTLALVGALGVVLLLIVLVSRK